MLISLTSIYSGSVMKTLKIGPTTFTCCSPISCSGPARFHRWVVVSTHRPGPMVCKSQPGHRVSKHSESYKSPRQCRGSFLVPVELVESLDKKQEALWWGLSTLESTLCSLNLVISLGLHHRVAGFEICFEILGPLR